MARALYRVDDGGIILYRRSDRILRALAKGRAEYRANTGRWPNTFYLTTTAFDDLEDSFPGHRQDTRPFFFGMTMKANDNLGLTDDEFEYGD